MRHIYGFLSAFLILTIYSSLVIFFVEPIIIEQLVMKQRIVENYLKPSTCCFF